MSKAQNSTNELARKDKQTSTALTVAQISDNMPIKAGDIESAVSIIRDNIAEGKKSWVNTALAVFKVLNTGVRGEQAVLFPKLCQRLGYSRSMMRNYQKAGKKLITELPEVEHIPPQMTEFLKPPISAPQSAVYEQLKEIARWTVNDRKWILFSAVTGEGEKVKTIGLRLKADDCKQPITAIKKQGSLIAKEDGEGQKRSVDYTAVYADGSEAIVMLATVDIGG